MDLNKKFQEAASSHTIKISSMDVERQYPIIKAESGHKIWTSRFVEHTRFTK
jgi:hypothetical protein